jgi:uncharacterized membrane protein
MIRYLFPALLAFQTLLATVLWGFPGPWLLAGVPAAFICAATIAHWRMPRETGGPAPQVRPGVIVLGGLFTIGFGVGGMALMWGASAPEAIAIEREIAIEAPREKLWSWIGDPSQRTRWSPWISDVEPIGRGGEPGVGAEWRATLLLERLAVPATLRLTVVEPEKALGWAIVPNGGGELEDMEEIVTIVPADDGSDRHTVRYRLSYRVPSVFGRVSERIVVRRPAERMVDEALNTLRSVSIGVQ